MKQLKPDNGKLNAERRSQLERRKGTTLAEVLVSIMILSIGLVSLATLFPISILRSLQATQLTNSAILSADAETFIDIAPELVHNPDGDNATVLANLLEHFQAPNTRNYIVDPLGWNRATANKSSFGLPFDNTNKTDQLPRFSGHSSFDSATPGITASQAEANALRTVTLPDSWVFQLDGTGLQQDSAGNFSSTQFTFDELTNDELKEVSIPEVDIDGDGTLDANEDLNGNGIFDTAESRIVIFDITGKKSQVRTITGISGQTVAWNDAFNDFANAGIAVGMARLETREPRYTWLLTVRQSPSGLRAQVDVVVLFRRPDPSTIGEKHYEAVFTGPTTTTNGSRDATVVFLTNDEPVLKKGGYILDATNAHWYRIQDINEVEGVPTASETTATLRLDRPALADGTAAMVVEGAIEVFPLKPKENIPLKQLLDN
ncbi:MAG: hypothetical protein HOL01_01290 [Planctomycetaceae bacterium]|jgi:hypothetical protein|nr:hypothetical protein [Planctomycetaceae bacterium]MBT6483515.1 hypothetical protein [Planctomycetaceae bacterium]MBT6493160.1 hypothetical protein [Planctomycetaceae bacterium]